MHWKGMICGTAVVLVSMAAGRDSLDEYMQELALAGNLQVERGPIVGLGLDANTLFDLKVQANWNCDYSVVKKGQQFDIVIEPDMRSVNVSIRHRMRLPEGGNQLSRTYRMLLLHEYDHVAISTDERPQLLLKALVNGIGTIRKPWAGPIPPPMTSVNALISAEVESRKAEVVRLVDDAYKRLDEVTDHGRREMDRRSFFGFVFTSDHLRAAKFSYPEEAENLIKTPVYLGAKKYFRL